MAKVEASDVSVVVVSYNTAASLARCLASIDADCELIVVDNASDDGSADVVRTKSGAILIQNDRNVGFGAANNQGVAIAKRPLILLLNSDAVAKEGAIDRLACVFNDGTVVAAGGRLVNEDGSAQNSCANNLSLWAVTCEQFLFEKALPRSKFFSPYWMTARLLNRGTGPHEVEQVMGACLMFRPVERFDERFFLYCEDTDLCRRLRNHGRILYVPDAVFSHELGASSASGRWRSVAFYNCGKELYFRIWNGWVRSMVCFLLDRLGALLRLTLWIVPTVLTFGLSSKPYRKALTFYRVLFAPTSYDRIKGKK
jgi:GT2 family glycosyltransferase